MHYRNQSIFYRNQSIIYPNSPWSRTDCRPAGAGRSRCTPARLRYQLRSINSPPPGHFSFGNSVSFPTMFHHIVVSLCSAQLIIELRPAAQNNHSLRPSSYFAESTLNRCPLFEWETSETQTNQILIPFRSDSPFLPLLRTAATSWSCRACCPRDVAECAANKKR